jgi:hypothetical protein
MGQITFVKNPTGKVGLGLFLLGIGAFAYSVVDPLFGPIAIACIGAGLVVAGLLSRRRPTVPHIGPRDADSSGDVPPPIEPR